jgi:hypothetical protein
MERFAAHPRVGSYGELLLADREGWPDWPPGAGDRPFYDTYLDDRGGHASRIHRHTSLFRYLDYVYMPRREFGAIGFKLMYDEAAPYPEILWYLRARGVRVLHLVRKNLLDIALSRMAMASRCHVHAWSPAEREDVSVHVDTTHLLRRLRRLELDRTLASAIIRIARLEVHEITYESLLADDVPLHRAFEFLGFDDAAELELSATMLKLAPASQRASIANLDEVVACLAGTRYQRFLRYD